MDKEDAHSKLARLLWGTLFGVVAFAFAVGGYAYYRSETERIRTEKYEEIAAIGKLKAGQIEEWRRERLADVSRSSKSAFFDQALQKWLREPNNTTLQAKLHDRIVLEQKEEGYADVLLVDPQYHILLSAEAQPSPLSPAEKSVIEQALVHRTPMLSDLYRSPRGIVHQDAVAPLFDSGNRPIAALVMRSDAESYLYPLIQSWPTPSRTAETLLVRKEGEDVLFLNDLRHRPSSALSLREPLTLRSLPAVQAVIGKKGIFQGKDYRGLDVLADLRHISGSPWFMVAKVDADEILAEVHYRAWVVALFTLLLIVHAAAMTAYAYRNRQVRLYKDLYRLEREQREAQEELRTTLYSIGDAVITTGSDGLVRRMNPIAERLTGWKEDEANGKPLDEVFHIVNEDSLDRVEDPVRRVLREGTVVGLANHTRLIAKNGTEFPIADSGAPIRDESGVITGVVLVFRDQTPERNAQKTLVESEQRFSKAFANNPAFLTIVHIRTNRVLEVNDAWTQIFGYTREEAVGRTTVELGIYDEETYRKIMEEAEAKGSVRNVEVAIKTRNGENRVLLISREVIRIKDEPYLLAMGLDITERKAAEQEEDGLMKEG